MKIIAEAGVNHNGNLNKAVEMVKAASEARAQYVKFQFYYPDILCVNRNNFDAYKLLDKVKMHPHWIPILAEECKRAGIEFLCTAFCPYSVEMIAPYVNMFKIASPEVADLNFIKEVAKYGKPLILSTGKVGDRELDKIFDNITNEIILLYCVSKYPSTESDYNLDEMERLRRRYGVKVGLSSHCKDIKVSLEAAKLGASFIEQHFMLERGCPDEPVSLFPWELKKLTEETRWKT